MIGWFVAVAWGTPALEAREAAASGAYAGELALYRAGAAQVEDVCRWSVRWSEARAALADGRAAIDHLERMKALSQQVATQVAAGTARPVDQLVVDWYVADATVTAGAPR